MVAGGLELGLLVILTQAFFKGAADVGKGGGISPAATSAKA